MNKIIGFIGCGNMAKAMIGGIINSKLTEPVNIIGSNPSRESLEELKYKYGINVTSNNKDAAKISDVLFLSVKPNKYNEVLSEIKDIVKDDVILIAIAPGININSIQRYFEKNMKIIRAMPNTPALVCEAMSAISYNEFVSDEDLKFIKDIFESFGEVEIIEENLMDIIPAVSGSSPAYVYVFIEALSDGAVKLGMKRDMAYKMAAQSVLGAAKMVLETNKHPGQLKDEVCSPGGTTIEAVYSLEKNNFRASVIEAMEKCTEKALKMRS